MADVQADDAGAKLLARGADVVLLDGGTYTVRMGFEALLTLEDRFESLEVFHSRLNARGFRDPKLQTILYGLEAGLAHYKATDVAPGATTAAPRPRWPAAALAAVIDPTRLIEYLDALMVAFWQAMPKPDEDAPKDDAGANGSHGRGTTTSPRSSSAGRKRRSG